MAHHQHAVGLEVSFYKFSVIYFSVLAGRWGASAGRISSARSTSSYDPSASGTSVYDAGRRDCHKGA